MPRFTRTIVFSMFLCVMVFSGIAQSQTTLKRGSIGPNVVLLQHILYQNGLLSTQPDGIFGPDTLNAVMRYQRAKKITVDGVVGRNTWSHINRDAARLAGLGQVELIHWDEAQHIYANFQVIRVIDVRTGKSFQARRYYGHRHADTEPYTAEDTAIIKEIYGGSSWERRPIIVEVDGRKIAASMNGMPHGNGAISDNNFNGHFCIHFLGSRIHLNGRIDLAHQAAVLQALGYRPSMLWLGRM